MELCFSAVAGFKSEKDINMFQHKTFVKRGLHKARLLPSVVN